MNTRKYSFFTRLNFIGLQLLYGTVSCKGSAHILKAYKMQMFMSLAEINKFEYLCATLRTSDILSITHK